MKLALGHLYPRLMNLYGDRGNIIALVRRAEWRGITVEYTEIGLGDKPKFAVFDLLFMGGGQDKDQRLIAGDFRASKGASLAEAIEDGVALLAVCGGYQMLGRSYRLISGEGVPGLAVLDLETMAGRKRMIGDVVLESSLSGRPRTLVGFENHSGRTYLGSRVRPLGRVLVGHGNNGEDGWEGCRYRNVIGTYLHGSLLPKNPWLADWLLDRAVRRRYGQAAELQPLDDSLEEAAHRAAAAHARARGPARRRVRGRLARESRDRTSGGAGLCPSTERW